MLATINEALFEARVVSRDELETAKKAILDCLLYRVFSMSQVTHFHDGAVWSQESPLMQQTAGLKIDLGHDGTPRVEGNDHLIRFTCERLGIHYGDDFDIRSGSYVMVSNVGVVITTARNDGVITITTITAAIQ